MAKSVDILEKRQIDILPMLSREELYDYEISDLSEMIMSIDHAVNYTEGCSFMFSCYGSEDTSKSAKAVMNELKDYLRLVKNVYNFKVNEKKRKENFLKGVNA